MKKLSLTTIVIALITTMAFSQNPNKMDSDTTQIERKDNFRRHSIGSSLFMLGNFAPGDPPNFFQLSYGYQLSRKNNIIVEAITWTYYEPLGTYGSSDELYPGKVTAFGIGLGYQRFLWKKSFATVVATPFVQQFYDSDDNKIQKGFQLYLQFIVGYRFEFFKKRLYIEPAYALKYWPVNTNFPDSFEEIESGAPNYKFEPSLNFGFKF